MLAGSSLQPLPLGRQEMMVVGKEPPVLHTVSSLTLPGIISEVTVQKGRDWRGKSAPDWIRYKKHLCIFNRRPDLKSRDWPLLLSDDIKSLTRRSLCYCRDCDLALLFGVLLGKESSA